MAKYRPVYFDFWDDYELLDYTPEEKYFYLFILTNPHTTACGVFSMHPRKMALLTGYHRETVDKLLSRFVEYGKIEHNKETHEILILNWLKYNMPGSKQDNIHKSILKELEQVKTQEFSKYVRSALTGEDPWKVCLDPSEVCGSTSPHNITEPNVTEQNKGIMSDSPNGSETNPPLPDQQTPPIEQPARPPATTSTSSVEHPPVVPKMLKPVSWLLQTWNEHKPDTLARVVKIQPSTERYRSACALLKDKNFVDCWHDVLYLLNEQPYLFDLSYRDPNSKYAHWLADFDWVIVKKGYIKVLEKKYINAQPFKASLGTVGDQIAALEAQDAAKAREQELEVVDV